MERPAKYCSRNISQWKGRVQDDKIDLVSACRTWIYRILRLKEKQRKKNRWDAGLTEQWGWTDRAVRLENGDTTEHHRPSGWLCVGLSLSTPRPSPEMERSITKAKSQRSLFQGATAGLACPCPQAREKAAMPDHPQRCNRTRWLTNHNQKTHLPIYQREVQSTQVQSSTQALFQDLKHFMAPKRHILIFSRGSPQYVLFLKEHQWRHNWKN